LQMSNKECDRTTHTHISNIV